MAKLLEVKTVQNHASNLGWAAHLLALEQEVQHQAGLALLGLVAAVPEAQHHVSYISSTRCLRVHRIGIHCWIIIKVR